MEKQTWQAPVLETLDVSATELGIGTTLVDAVWEDGKLRDLDIYDPS